MRLYRFQDRTKHPAHLSRDASFHILLPEEIIGEDELAKDLQKLKDAWDAPTFRMVYEKTEEVVGGRDFSPIKEGVSFSLVPDISRESPRTGGDAVRPHFNLKFPSSEEHPTAARSNIFFISVNRGSF